MDVLNFIPSDNTIKNCLTFFGGYDCKVKNNLQLEKYVIFVLGDFFVGIVND